MNIRLCLFSSTPDMANLSFVVKVLMGPPQELAQRAVAWGYDGIEFMPDPALVPHPQGVEAALNVAGTDVRAGACNASCRPWHSETLDRGLQANPELRGGSMRIPAIRTVLGDINPEDVGVTSGHEHLLIRSGLVLAQEPGFRLDSVEKAAEEVRDYQKYGGQALVDMAPIGYGRDPDGLATVARLTGLHIIACTGLHKPSLYLDSHWRFQYSVEEIAKLFLEEVELGMDQFGYEGPLIKRSKARAGVVKVASDYHLIDGAARVAFEAAAVTSQATGVPIVTHTESGTAALDQVRILQDFGVAPSNVVLSHVDRNPDPCVHHDLAQTGAYLVYDSAGRIRLFPESALVGLIRYMFEHSHGDRIILGGDLARRSYWKAYGGGPGLAYVVKCFVPRLRREGFDDSQIRRMLVDNPAHAFALSATAQAPSTS